MRPEAGGPVTDTGPTPCLVGSGDTAMPFGTRFGPAGGGVRCGQYVRCIAYVAPAARRAAPVVASDLAGNCDVADTSATRNPLGAINDPARDPRGGQPGSDPVSSAQARVSGEPGELVVPNEYRGAGRTIDRPGVESLECLHVGVSAFSAGMGEELSSEVAVPVR